MDKNNEIKLVGQPIFKQVINLLGVIDLKGIIQEHESDRHYKTFNSKTRLTTLLFGILSRCDSMTEICKAMRDIVGKLNHF